MEFPGPAGSSPQMAEAERAADHVFMQLLNRLTLDGRTVSDRPGPNYAPAAFAKETEAQVAKVSKKRLEDAMRRLFAAKRIRISTITKGGHERNVLTLS
jgi:hypothetical protein